MNTYRIAHPGANNKAKIAFQVLMQPQIDTLPFFSKISVEYKLFVGSRRLIDTNNFCSIIDKYLMDALTKSGKIVDDNYKYYVRTMMEYGGYDPGNERCEIIIKEAT
ncbi:MAG: hypothetical protein K0U41_06610 [Gammaproteobacteria bacterium]|nr:hypothetical protein [Gammaproteobacteria bacterium]